MAELHPALLDLHRAIIAFERETYERRTGEVNAAAFLSALLQDQAYAWLHPLTALIARMDDEEADSVTAEEIRALLRPDSAGTPLQQRYAWLMDLSPDVAFAHGTVMRALKAFRPASATLH